MAALGGLCLLGFPAHAATYHVSPNGSDAADGSARRPWRTIEHGAAGLRPGDTLVIGAGIYRELIRLEHGGTPTAPITLEAEPGARVVVTGADRLDTGWTREAPDGVYSRDWPYVFPIATRPDGTYVLTHPDDLEHRLTGRAEQVMHHERLLRQVLERGQLAPGTFWVDLAGKRLYVWLRDSADPTHSDMEASTRSRWLEVGPGVSYVHIRGIRFRYAANHAQRGAFSLDSGGSSPPTHWLVEDCVFERANGPGASLTGTGHVFRRCAFQDNGQLGFGTSRCHDMRMEACLIARNNVKGYSTGWEAGGLKVTMSRRFAFVGCQVVDNRGCGIWYDIGNEQAEVAGCTITDNDEAGIFYEISYGLHAHDNLIVNNANAGERPGGAWGEAGITLSSSEGCVVEGNRLLGNRDGIDLREQDRTTPRIDQPDHEVQILNRGHRIRNNVVAFSQAYNIGFWMDTNFFGPHPSGADKDRPRFEDPRTLDIRLEGNVLWPLPGRPNYLYGVPWRAGSRTMATPAQFAAESGIPDTDRVSEPSASALPGSWPAPALRGRQRPAPPPHG